VIHRPRHLFEAPPSLADSTGLGWTFIVFRSSVGPLCRAGPICVFFALLKKHTTKEPSPCEDMVMKTAIALIAIVIVVVIQSGCTTRAGASVGHGGERHGLSARGSTENGVSAGVRAY